MAGVITSITAVFTAILGWFEESFVTVSGIFYGTEGLTFIGTISVIGFSIAITLLVLAWVRSLLKNRG